MALMTVSDIAEAGIADLDAATAAVNSSDTFPNGLARRTLLFVYNGSGGSINVTIPVQTAAAVASGFGALTKADIVRSVANGKWGILGPFEACYENATGLITANYSGTSSVKSVARTLRTLSAT